MCQEMCFLVLKVGGNATFSGTTPKVQQLTINILVANGRSNNTGVKHNSSCRRLDVINKSFAALKAVRESRPNSVIVLGFRLSPAATDRGLAT